jgi:hypothetical protein
LRPGPASKIVSPLHVSAYLEPGAEGKVRIELLGEDGRLLVRKLLTYTTLTRLHLLADLEFEIAAVAEAARLQIVTEDSYGRIISLASVDVVLLSVGDNDLNPGAALTEPLVIRGPRPNMLIQGGKVVIEGQALPTGGDLLLVELIDREGRIVGYRQAAVNEPDQDEHGRFSVEVPYTVSRSTWVRVTVTRRGGRIPGPTHISSIEILLSP